MVFWIGILIAVGFAYSAIKLGFYQAWTTLFNVVIAVYLGVMFGPVIEGFVPMDSQYSRTLAVLAAGVGAFAVLHGISYVFLLGQFTVTFPRALNTLGSGLFGFLTGFLVWSFAAIVVCTTPLSDNAFVKDIGFDSRKLEEVKVQSYLVWWCDLVDKVAAPGALRPGSTSLTTGGSPRLRSGQAGQAVRDLLTKPAKHKKTGTAGQPDSTQPADVNEPNEPGFAEGLRPPQGVLRRGEPNYPRRPYGWSSSPNETQPHTVIPP